MSTMMTSEDGVVLGEDGVEAERRRKVGTHAQWRGAQRGAPSRCRHSQLSPPLFARGSPGAELSGLALGAAAHLRGYYMRCSGFAHPHARRGPMICEMYFDDRS